MTRRGADVSHYHPIIDAKALATARLDFLLGKVSEGAGGPDHTWAANRDLAFHAGIERVGGYHFHRFATTPRGNVDAFLRNYGDPARCTLRPSWDLEDTKAVGSQAQLADALQETVGIVKAELGVNPMLYTGDWWWVPRIGSHAPWAVGMFLWLSGYTAHQPPIPAPWAELTIWQDGDKGNVPGISGLADTNVATDEAFAALIAGHPVTPSPTTPPEEDPLMAAEAEIIAAIKETGNEVIAFLTKVIGDDPGDSSESVTRMVKSMFTGNYGETHGFAGGDLSFLDRHVAAAVKTELADLTAKVDELLAKLPTPTA